MIRTTKYETSVYLPVYNTSNVVAFPIEQRDFNRRFDNAWRKAKTHQPNVSRLTNDSWTVQGSELYMVRRYYSDTEVYVHCNCEAGTHNAPCYHAMRVLQLYGQTPTTLVAATNAKSVTGRAIEAVTSGPRISLTLKKGEKFTAETNVKITVEPAN